MTDVNYDREAVRSLVNRIVGHLIEKGRRTMKRQDQNNKTVLADVSFWFEMKYDAKGQLLDQDMILSFSHSPDMWNCRQLLDHLENAERNWLLQDGVNISGYQQFTR
jgi:hypothetical protein